MDGVDMEFVLYEYEAEKGTFLTILGVTIGVILVVALLAVGLGVKNEMIDSVIAGGSVNQIKVYSEAGGKHKDRMITDRTVNPFSEITNVSGCYPIYEIPVTMRYGSYEYYGELVGIPGNELGSWSMISDDGNETNIENNIENKYDTASARRDRDDSPCGSRHWNK